MAKGYKNDYPVDKKLLYVGRTFKNWKEVCSVFDWKYNGNRETQIYTLKRYCNFITCGSGSRKGIIITEVFDTPKPAKKVGRPMVEYRFAYIPEEHKYKRGVYIIQNDEGELYGGKADRKGGFKARCADYQSYLKRGVSTAGTDILRKGGKMYCLYAHDYNEPNPFVAKVEDTFIDYLKFEHKDKVKNKLFKIMSEHPVLEHGYVNWEKLKELGIVDVTYFIR